MSGNSSDIHEPSSGIGTRSFEGLATLGTHPSFVRSVGRFCSSASITYYHKEEARANFKEAFGELVQSGFDKALIELLDYDKNYPKLEDAQTPGVVFKAVKEEPGTSWGILLRKSRLDIACYDADFKLKIDKISDMLPEINDNWGAIPEDLKRELVTLLFPEFSKVLDFKVGDKMFYGEKEYHTKEGHFSVISGTLTGVSINLVESIAEIGSDPDSTVHTRTDESCVTYSPIFTLSVKSENGVAQVITVDNHKKLLNIKVADTEHTLP